MVIGVIIVDDSAFIRRVYREMLSQEPDIEVLAEAENPLEARELIKKHNPDVITLDIEMPKMDGLSFLEKIMSLRPMPVVMSSSLTQEGADETLRALELGAVEIIGKPLEGEHAIVRLHQELVTKVRAAAKAKVRPLTKLPTQQSVNKKGKIKDVLVAVGASTGGVEALKSLISRLPARMPPIVITQHMPAHFTNTFAKRLDSVTPLSVKEAENGDLLVGNTVYIAPGDRHMEVKKSSSGKGFLITLNDGVEVSGHKPSVDVLFNSVAKYASSQSVGVILTGMGKDGAKGLLTMREAGAKTLGQNEDSCVVYGMPKAAKMLGGVEKELSLENIPNAIVNLVYSA